MDLEKLNYYYTKFKYGEDNFHYLMQNRVREILLVSTLYDAYTFEQESRLSQKLVGEYHEAIKLVYASVYLQNTKSYIEGLNCRLEEEKLAVVIQEIVGQEFDGFYYPHISGVAQSYNFLSYRPP